MTTIQSTSPAATPFGQSCIILDVRTAVEHAEVALKQDHHHIPVDDFDAKKFLTENHIDAARPVYTLCRSGKRALRAAEALAAAGHANVQVIEGGIVACEAAGVPVRKGAVMSLERQVRIAAGTLVVAGVALGAFVSPLFYGLSAFVGCGLVFAGVTDFCGMGLLLAKAPWNRGASGPRPACSAAATACAATPAAATPDNGAAEEGITFYSPANGKPTPVHFHALTKTGGSAGGCS